MVMIFTDCGTSHIKVEQQKGSCQDKLKKLKQSSDRSKAEKIEN